MAVEQSTGFLKRHNMPFYPFKIINIKHVGLLSALHKKCPIKIQRLDRRCTDERVMPTDSQVPQILGNMQSLPPFWLVDLNFTMGRGASLINKWKCDVFKTNRAAEWVSKHRGLIMMTERVLTGGAFAGSETPRLGRQNIS
jgi:hypothetical protein